MVKVQLNTIESGSWANNSGIFTGQNIQNSWDSHGPTMSGAGGMFGDFSMSISHFTGVWVRSTAAQPTWDQDVKGNGSPQFMR